MKRQATTYAITATANAIAYGLSAEDISLLAAIFVQLGDTLETIATQKTLCKSSPKSKTDI